MHQRQNGRMKLADAGFNAGFVDNILNGLEIILIVNLNHIPFESFGHLMFVLSGGFLPVGFADPAFFQGLVNLFIFFVISFTFIVRTIAPPITLLLYFSFTIILPHSYTSQEKRMSTHPYPHPRYS